MQYFTAIGQLFTAYVTGITLLWVAKHMMPAPSLEKRFKPRSGQRWVIVTGATSGIGEEFAAQLAQKGFNLLLVSRSQNKLQQVCDDLQRKYGVETDFIAVDLESFPNAEYTARDFLEDVDRKTSDGELCLIVCNAGMSDLAQHFTDIPLERNQKLIHMNTISNVSMIQTLLPKLVLGNDLLDISKRPKRGIITVGAVNSIFPAPIFGVSSGNKHFIRGFTLAIRQEFEKQLDMMVAHPAAVYSNILSKKAAYGITAKFFVKNCLNDFAKGRPESFGSVLHEMTVLFMIKFMSQHQRGALFQNALHHFEDVLNRPVNDSPIEKKLRRAA